LVITAFPKPLSVSGHGHDYVYLALFAIDIEGLPQDGGKPAGQGRYLLVLQKNNGPCHGLGIRRIAAGKVEIIKAALAYVTEGRPFPVEDNGGDKWPSATNAARARERPKRSQTGSAKGDSSRGVQ
jgi:hypothetical protein